GLINMDKYQCATSYYNSFIKLNDPQKEDFSRICNKLLNCNFICNKKQSDQKDFYLIISSLDLYTSYFALMDYELSYFDANNVISIKSIHNYNHRNFKKMESIILLILRKLYFIKMQEISLNEHITTSIEELHIELATTNILKKRITKQELRESLMVLKGLNIIENMGNLDLDETIIIIYPTILYLVSMSTIEEINAYLNQLKIKEVSDETIS
ncbi:MAG: DUF4194 domain-containing protein, partial [Bacilli bacterium]